MIRYLTVEIDGRIERVPAVKSRGRLWYHYRGETVVVDLESSANARAPGAKTGTSSGLITAPMPGRITQVNVVTNEHVTKGQVLVVMEAMKMEYTLEADVAGRVTEVLVTAGAQVALGATLVKVGAG